MLAGFKSRPSSSSLRPVPCGGLGGCVEVKSESPRTDYRFQEDMIGKKVRKKPMPIQVLDTPHIARKSLASKLDTSFPTTPRTPMYTRDLPTPLILGHDVNFLSPNQLWDKSKDGPWTATTPRKECWYTIPSRPRPTQPAELPGSLLLPSQGFAQNNPPSTPPRPNRPSRTGSDSTVSSLPPSLTHSCQSTPNLRPSLRSVYNSPLQKSLPRLPSSGRSSPIKSAALGLMSCEQLLRVLPELEAQEITNRWLLAMEKELTRLRKYALDLHKNDEESVTLLQPFSQEIRRVLKQAEVMCESHDEEFRSAQESTDLNHESDQVKIVRMHCKLLGIMPSYSLPNWLEKPPESDFESIRMTLVQSIQTISGFIRNQLTFQLHRYYRGLPETIVELLRDFDRDVSGRKTKAVSGSAHDSAPTSNLQPPVKDTTSQELSQQAVSPESSKEDFYGHVHQAQQIDLKEVKIGMHSIGSQYNESHEIIYSYFDTQSVSSDNDSTLNESPDYEDLMIEFDKETEIIRCSFMPLPLQSQPQPQPQSQPQPQPQPQPQSQPQPQPQPQHSDTSISTTSSPQPPSYTTSVIPPTLSTDPETTEFRYKTELAIRDFQLDDLRRKIEMVETQNRMLRENIGLWMRQVEIGVGLVGGAGGGGDGKVPSRFTFQGLRHGAGRDGFGRQRKRKSSRRRG